MSDKGSFVQLYSIVHKLELNKLLKDFNCINDIDVSCFFKSRFFRKDIVKYTAHITVNEAFYVADLLTSSIDIPSIVRAYNKDIKLELKYV